MKLMTLVIMVVVMGGLMRFAKPYIMKAAGVPQGIPGVEGMETLETAHFSSEESDLMATVFKSAMKLFTGQAKREELASELSDKLYAGRADKETMAELGIELVKPGADSPDPLAGLKSGAGATAPGTPAKPGTSPSAPATTTSTASAGPAKPGANPTAAAGLAKVLPGAKLAAKPGAPAGVAPAADVSNKIREALLGRLWEKAKANPELSLVPVVLLGMVGMHLFKRRRSPEDDFIIPLVGMQTPADSEPYDMKHAVHSLQAEEFELLVALIYQRQGYRVSMPSALSGGRGGDFLLLRKAERLLVQCKKLSQDHAIHVDRVRELHEAVAAAGATRGLFVASCSFSWDARNFGKAKGVTLINARTLDALVTAAQEKPDEDLLAIAQWVPKLISKVQFTTPQCPACGAPMDQVSSSHGSVWVCSQRPDCRGRRNARKYHKTTTTPAAQTTDQPVQQPTNETAPRKTSPPPTATETASAPQAAPGEVKPARRVGPTCAYPTKKAAPSGVQPATKAAPRVPAGHQPANESRSTVSQPSNSQPTEQEQARLRQARAAGHNDWR
jgi:ssDNA-binding Zn-finger/Zn-ribbon topoisomerase 1